MFSKNYCLTCDIVSVSLPEITPELAEQIVNQVALQQDANTHQNDAILDDVQVIQVPSSSISNTGNQELLVEGHLVTQGQIPHQVIFTCLSVFLFCGFPFVYY